MRPETKLWRKSLRAARKHELRGRRLTHKVKTLPPRPGSTWQRRHWWDPAVRDLVWRRAL